MAIFSKLSHQQMLDHPQHLVTHRKLDLALKDGPPRRILGEITQNKKCSVSRGLLNCHLTNDQLLSSKLDTDLWPQMLQQIMNDTSRGVLYGKRKDDLSGRVAELSLRTIKLQTLWMFQNYNLKNKQSVLRDFAEWSNKLRKTHPLIRNLLYIENHLSTFVETSGTIPYLLQNPLVRLKPDSIKGKLTGSIQELDVKFIWSNNLIATVYADNIWLHQRNYLLQIHNKVCDLISILTLITSTDAVCYEDESLELTINVVRELCSIACKYGNTFFEIVRSLEGLITGEILFAEEDWENKSLLQSINDDFNEIDYDYFGSELQYLIREASTPLKQEIGGLSKVIGHPIIDLQGTAQRAYSRATKEFNLNLLAINETRNLAVESYIRNYILKHRKWPRVTIDRHAPQALHEAYLKGKDPRSKKIVQAYGVTKPGDYVFIELEQEQSLDKLSHYVQYIKDKTVSLSLSKTLRYFINPDLNDKYRWDETRLLLVYLFNSNDSLGINEYLQDYINSSEDMELVLDYLIIKLCPKEKELKFLARLFGCKTYQDRYRGKVQEENVVNFMNHYVEDQSMTLDDIGLIKRLYAFRNLTVAYKGWRVLYVNFDVSGWCSNFRHETVKPIAQDVLDKYYGTTNFFGKTHSAYNQGLFYIPKEDLSGAYHWVGQDGGIEGLNQDTWMMVYIPQMRYALREFQLHFFVMAYGDDYKAALLIPPDQSHVRLDTFKTRIIESVANTALVNFGQNMKIFDSYGSECYISFCKNASLNTIELPQGFRKIQKCYGATNAFLPTLDDYIASAFSNAHSAARYMPVCYGPYFVACFWSFYHLLRHWLYEDLSDECLVASLLVPSCVGGFPIIYLHNFFVRGESDHLCAYVDLLKFLEKSDPKVFVHASQGLEFETLSDHKFIPLFRDPYSLPIKKPPLPSSVFRNLIMPVLKPMIKNEDMLDLLDLADDEFSEHIITSLGNSHPFNPRILSTIYSTLPESLIEEFMRKFENATTIKDLLVRRKGARQGNFLLRRVVKAESALQEWRRDRLKVSDSPGYYWTPLFPWCPVTFTKGLRRLWGKELEGVTMPPPHHLLKFVEPEVGVYNDYDLRNHFTYKVQGPVTHMIKDLPSHHWVSGPFSPFLGYKTRLGSDLPQMRFIEKNPLLSKLRSLLDVESWVNKSIILPTGEIRQSNLPEIIKDILRQYYTEDPSVLLPFSQPRKSGTIYHHWRSPHFKEYIMPNSLYNTYTWVLGESDTHMTYRASVDKYTVNFLLLMCHSVNIGLLAKEFSSTFIEYAHFWAVTVDCKECNTPIIENPIVVDGYITKNWTGRHLAGVTIDKISQEVILDSLREWQGTARKPCVPNDELTLEVAALGVCQKFIEQSASMGIRLSDKFETPLLTADNQQLLMNWVPGNQVVSIRETEIRHIPPSVLAKALISYAFSWILKTYGSFSVAATELKVWTSNPRDLPWYRMMELIEKAGVLGLTIQEVERLSYTPPGMVFDNALSASRYISTASLSGAEYGILENNCALLSYYEDDQIDELLDRIGTSYKWNVFFKNLVPLYKATVKYELGHELKILEQAILILLSSEVVQFQTLDWSTNPQQTLNHNPLDIEIPDDDYLDMLKDDETSALSIGLNYLKKIKEIPVERLSCETGYADQGYMMLEGELKNFGNCTIVRTTLADCINKIRDEPIINPITYRTDFVNPSRKSIGFSLPRISTSWSKIEFHHIEAPNVQTVVLPVTTPVLETQEILLSGHYFYRPYSKGVTSCNKILEIFGELGVDIKNLTKKHFACLGEGYGGILDMIASVSQTSHFLYNTLPPEGEGPTLPHIALPAIQENNHSLDCELVNFGVYDLREDYVIQALVRGDNLKYDMVICDAEADWSELTKYTSLLMNVVKFFVLKRSKHGILILKGMLDVLPAIINTVSSLCYYCEHVTVLRLAGSPPGGEVYICAWGFKNPFTDQIGPIPPIVSRKVTTLHRRLKRHFDNQYPNKEIKLEIPHLINFPYLKRYFGLLTPTFRIKLLGEHSLGISSVLDTFTTVKQSRECLRDILPHLKELLKLLESSIQKLDQRSTAATGVAYGRRYLFLQSLIQNWPILLHPEVTIFQGFVRQSFINTLFELPQRMIPANCIDDIFNKEITWHGVLCSPFGEWMEGINVLLSWRAWIVLRQI